MSLFSSFYVQPLLCSHLTGDHFNEFWIKAIQYTWIFSLAIKPTEQNLRLVPWLEWNHIAVMAHFHRRDESVKTVTDGSLKFLNPHVIEIMLQIKHGFDSAKGQKCFYCLLYISSSWLPSYMHSNNFIEKALLTLTLLCVIDKLAHACVFIWTHPGFHSNIICFMIDNLLYWFQFAAFDLYK